MSRRFFNPMFQVTRSLRESGVNAGQSGARLSEHLTHRDPRPEHKKLLREARKDPELYILYILTAATVGAYGWYQPHFWAAITGETKVSKIEGTEPWKDGAEGSTGKYRYHARATPGKEARVKDAPSALNTVIVPNVNLPRSLHEKYNKWGKDEYDEY
ncbi:hypothetical protein D6C77_05097 [Aureobasidium pullulans]|nr:hypothetical protein D6C77_05097 [Aureobasidium pullulans]TIA80910.1 hypothetical protein D6C76_02986 [Aureobasidium pullulans]